MAINFIKNPKYSSLTKTDYETCLQLCDDIKGNPPPSDGHIYGIKRLRTSSSPAWERTDESVNLIANATHDGTTVQNDFDNIYPWSDIKSFNYNKNLNVITAYYGDENFSFTPTDTNINVFTKIPEFWYKRWVDDDDYEYIQIATYAASGFTKVNEFAVARYITGGTTDLARSISGNVPLGGQTPNNFRTINQTMGTNVHLFDIKSLSAIQLLYLVEYANYNAQDILGNGYVNGSGLINNGTLDSLGMKSGCLVNDGTAAVIYRGIENIYGNVYTALDGINVNQTHIYISYEPSNYDYSDIDNTYNELGYILPVEGANWVEKLGYDVNNPSIMLPIQISSQASDSTYITDRGVELGIGTSMVYFGGGYTQGQYAGLFRYLASMSADTVGGAYRCSRAILESIQVL